jgi:PAS domain S-box-containing protein/putative nucleotidyltransferase with HDIG domain
LRTHAERKLKNILGSVPADISRVEELKDKLSQTEERYRTILDQMQDSYYEVDLGGNYTFLSESAGDSLGYSCEEMIGKNYRLMVLEEDTGGIFTAFNEVYRTGKPNRGFPHRIRHKDGSIIFSEVSIDLKRNNRGEVTGFKCVSRDISERRQMEEDLREGEELFKTLLENAPDGVYMNDLEGNFLYGNRKCEEIIGYQRGELIGKNFLELNILPESSLARAAQLLQDNIDGKSTGPDELELIRKDGRHIPIEINTNIVPRKGRTVVLAFVRDISERKQAEEALRESEAYYRLLAEHTADTVWLMDKSLKPTYQSPSVEKLRGFTLQEIREMPLEQRLTPESLKLASELFFKELPRVEADPGYNPVHILDLEYYCKDGTTTWSENKFSVIRDKNGKLVSILGEGRDITDRRRAEKALMKSEERFRDMASLLPQVIFEADEKGKFTFVNRQGLEIFGYSASEAAGMNVLETIIPQDRSRAMENIADRIKGQNSPPNEYTAIRKDGSTFPVTIYASPIMCNSRAGMRGILIDITERKQTEAILRESEAKYRLLAENARDIIWTMDTNLQFTYMSPSVLRIRGYTAEEVMAQSLEEIFTPSSIEIALKAFEEELALESMEPKDLSRMRTLELEHICKGGSTVWVEINMSFLRDTDGQPIAILGVSRDITERKLAEEKLAKSYKSLRKTLNDSIETMVKIVEMRDPYTAGHQRKVADLATAIAEEMKFGENEIEQLKMAAIIHDIGKIYVPSDILNKPGKLSEIELQLIRSHSQYGHDIVTGMNCPCSVSQAILQHHERLDGSGYPNRLRGEDTLLEAKILAVADVVEAIASHRPYRPARGVNVALEEISKNKGKLYDPDVVDACLKLFYSGKFEFKPI